MTLVDIVQQLRQGQYTLLIAQSISLALRKKRCSIALNPGNQVMDLTERCELIGETVFQAVVNTLHWGDTVLWDDKTWK